MELKIWWKPNFIDTDFEMPVKSITDAYISLQALASLDLLPSDTALINLYNEFPEKQDFINMVKIKYHAYRVLHHINGNGLITDNIGGLLVLENNEWVDWVDGNYYDSLIEATETLEMRGYDIKKYLSETDERLFNAVV